ncbi:MAG: sugar phosphate nucleotidyltransferase [Bacteroidales bacterium]|nr:sugar phosphate nucleotidyltransferase [Bacteroidales bacterium]HNW72780.1 sugar phosphate nucleotidyltransferase [Bacteroidales bacterium]HPS50129.1 sugar phosphate nucleotidyltransferase [Bacteroidales bacterium]
MKAVILAGGKGTRLKPYTSVIPKPLVPVGERAILEILVTRLKKAGVDEIYICLNHFAEIIMAFFGDGSRFGLKINYSIEQEPLGTVAPIKLIRELPDHFLVMNGDLLTDLNFSELFQYHLEGRSLLTVSTYIRNMKIDFGVIDVDEKSMLARGFREKPEYTFSVSMGVYVMNRKVLDFVPDSTSFGFDDLMLTLLKKNEPARIYPYHGYWLDIGRPDDYEKANDDIEFLNKIL